MNVGRLEKLYYNSATYGTPTWVLVDKVSDVTVSLTRNTGQRGYRGSANQKTMVGNKIFQITATYEESSRIADTVLDAFKTSYFADSSETTDATMDIAAMDQAIATSGAYGIRGFFMVTDLTKNEPLEDGVTRNLVLDEVYHEESSAVVDADEYTVA